MSHEITVGADELDLRDMDAGYWFELESGGPDSAPSVRGVDVQVSGKAGMEPRNRVAVSIEPVLKGIVFGTGDTGTEARESYRTRFDALKAICSPTEMPFPLTILAPLEGLVAGSSASLLVRFLRFVGPASVDAQVREVRIEFECVDTPPEWVVT